MEFHYIWAMKKSILFIALSLLLACGDGDLQIEAIDFDSVSVQSCETPVATAQNILFKINDDEALIMTLQSGVLNNGVIGTDTIETMSTVPGQTQLLYRIFSGSVTQSYFCSDFPPVEPLVTEEIEAQDGAVIINTVMNADTTAFVHTIQLSGITLVNNQGERITDLTINEFGDVTTLISQN